MLLPPLIISAFGSSRTDRGRLSTYKLMFSTVINKNLQFYIASFYQTNLLNIADRCRISHAE